MKTAYSSTHAQAAATSFETIVEAFKPFYKGEGDADTALANVVALAAFLQNDPPQDLKEEAMGYLSTYACNPAIVDMTNGETTRQACAILYVLAGDESFQDLDMNPLRVIDNIALDKDLVGFMPSGLLVMSTLMQITSMRPVPHDIRKDKKKRDKHLEVELRRTDRNDQYKVEMASVWAHANKAATGEREALAAVADESSGEFNKRLASAFRLQPTA